MQQKKIQSHGLLTQAPAPTWQNIGRSVIMVAIVAGILFRVVNLGAKPYWMDECYTLLRVSGHTVQEAKALFFGGQIVRAGEMLPFQQPSAAKGVRGTIAGLAKEEPQHPPLYFVLSRFWAKTWGYSKIAMRSLPALFAILGIPAVFWLGWEMFGDRAVAGLATAFYSLSPMMVQYAQAARQYSLWVTLMMVASALLPRFLRQPKASQAGLYGLVMAIALYTHLLTGLVLIGHGIYLILHEKLRLTVALRRWGIASLLAVGVALPWLGLVWQNREVASRTTSWMRYSIPWSRILHLWNLSFSKSFIALHFSHYQILVYAGILLAILVIYAFYYCFAHAPARSWGMISALAGTVFLPFLAADILLGGRLVVSDRYFLICYVCIYFVVAFLLVTKIKAKPRSGVWQGLTLGLLTLSLLASATGVFSTSWWGWSEYEQQIPPVVQSVDRPLMVVPEPFYDSFRFAHEYDPEFEFIFIEDLKDFKLPPDRQDIFFFLVYPTPEQMKTLAEMGLEPTPVYTFLDPSTDFELKIYQAKMIPKPSTQSMLIPNSESDRSFKAINELSR